MLGVSSAFVNMMISGQERVPQKYILSISEFLKLTHEETIKFLALIALQQSVVELTDLFSRNPTRKRRRKRTTAKPVDRDLKSFFANPMIVCNRLLRYAESLADTDSTVYPNVDKNLIMHMHLEGALRVTSDIDRFVSQEEFPLLNAQNIFYHLKYPSNYYLGFFLECVDAADGGNVGDLQDEISCLSTSSRRI